MKWKAVSLVCVILLLVGCGKADTSVKQAVTMRNKLLEGNGCSFSATVTADYGKEIYQFTMDCQSDKHGNITFTVTTPETIRGITGRITGDGGAITFDDTVLAFQMLADGQVTPVSAPWLLVKTMRSGYLNGCSVAENGVKISIDDSYAEEALHLEILANDLCPVSAEIYWQGRRVLTLLVESFTYL